MGSTTPGVQSQTEYKGALELTSGFISLCFTTDALWQHLTLSCHRPALPRWTVLPNSESQQEKRLLSSLTPGSYPQSQVGHRSKTLSSSPWKRFIFLSFSSFCLGVGQKKFSDLSHLANDHKNPISEGWYPTSRRKETTEREWETSKQRLSFLFQACPTLSIKVRTHPVCPIASPHHSSHFNPVYAMITEHLEIFFKKGNKDEPCIHQESSVPHLQGWPSQDSLHFFPLAAHLYPLNYLPFITRFRVSGVFFMSFASCSSKWFGLEEGVMRTPVLVNALEVLDLWAGEITQLV